METTKQDQLTEVLQNKIYKKLEENKEKANPFVNRIETESKLLNDFILPIGKDTHLNFTSNGSLKMEALTRNDIDVPEIKSFSLHPWAIQQCANKLIPTDDGRIGTYVRNLSESGLDWKKNLAAEILNQNNKNATHRHRVLVREINGEIRGVLSDQFRRMDTGLIFESFIRAGVQNQVAVWDAFTDGLRSYIEVVDPQLVPIPFYNSEFTHVVFGARISNSDFGDGALELRAFMLQAVCINGMVTKSRIREVHLGSRLPDNLLLSQQTYQLDTQTQASAVKDIVNDIFSKDSITRQAMTIQNMQNHKVDIDEELKKLQKLGVWKGETEEMKKVFMDNKPSDGVAGENSLWKIAQGLSAVAREKDSRRKRDLEEISGKLFEKVKLH